jgi:hypothetical protein
MSELFQLLLRLQSMLLGLGLIAALFWQIRRKRCLGVVEHRALTRDWLRLAGWGALLALGGLAYLQRMGPHFELRAAVLALAGAAGLLQPSPRESRLGTQGVQRGWDVRRFPQLEEWRLIGDHLRWRLHGEWISTEVPSTKHPELRARLEASAAARENPHGRGRGRPEYV